MDLRALNLAAPLVLVTHVLAQPNPFGCHYFRHAPGGINVRPGARELIDDVIARSDTFDILHYDITLDVTRVGEGSLVASTRIDLVPRMADQTFIRFDLFELVVDSVTNADGSLNFSHDGEFLRVDFSSPAIMGEAQALTVHYHGVPHRDADWGGFYFESGYAYNLGIGISTIPPNFGKVWYPCFDSFVERASYTYHVKSAGGYRFHGQGELIDEVQLGGDTIVRSFDLPQEIPTHISAVAVSAYVDHDYVHSGTNGDIPVRLTSKVPNQNNMINRFADLGAAIDACEYWYGAYPYERVGYVLTTDGALEIPTNVAYPQSMLNQNIIDNRGLYAHELGHHWWGDVVTPRVHNDMWLKEGPAEYSGHLLEEWLDGERGLIAAVKDNHYYVLRAAHVEDDGFQALSPMPDAHIYGTHTYYKGASVMHNLRGYLGDELFREAMRGVQIDLANTDMSAEGFKEAIEARTGVDMDPFFDAWVFAPGFSVFEIRDIEVQAGSPSNTVTLQIGQKLRAANVLHQEVPIDVTFIDSNGAEFEQRITAGGELTSVSLDVPFVPEMVVLNRRNRLNQARMDNEITLIPGETFLNEIPYVDFRVFDTELVDTTLVRVDHIWCSPDQAPLASDVTAISTTHYWNVDGLWPEGTVLRGRLYYFGQESDQFDHELIAGNETGMVVLFRPTPNDTWTVFPGQTVSAGNITNGSGYITFDGMQKGQYAFGKAVGPIGVEEGPDVPFTVQLFPDPATDRITVTGNLDGHAQLWWDVIGADGRFVQRTRTSSSGAYRHELDVSGLAAGTYVLRAQEAHGSSKVERRFQVVR
ncbi:MAG TPA: M1 family aminopeptidase [Flavobacteriales bacterium]|nr:M1 family aminopeptidase [Flavobacteriales bacterium]